jgi:hypothetical protein
VWDEKAIVIWSACNIHFPPWMESKICNYLVPQTLYFLSSKRQQRKTSAPTWTCDGSSL